jgi:hypothetical protein
MPFLPWSSAAGTVPWLPADDGFLGANSDPETASGGGLLTVGTAYLARMPLRVTQTITNLWFCMTLAGTGTANGFSGMWIVSGATGAVLAQSADQTAAFTGATGWLKIPMAAATAIPAGTFPYAVLLCNLLTTQPTALRQLNTVNDAPQAVPSLAGARWAQQAAFGAAVGAVTLASNAASAFSNVILWN